MKKTVITILIVLAIVFVFFYSCRREKDPNTKEIVAESIADDSLARELFRPNQILVFFKREPSQQRINKLKKVIIEHGVTDSIQVRRCNTCSGYVELWTAEGVHTVIHGQGVLAGTGGGGSTGVGEDSIASYSLNFLVRPPLERQDMLSEKELYTQARGDGQSDHQSESTVLVAVLDTGIDTTQIINPRFLWRNKSEVSGSSDRDGNCYPGDVRGWNFVNNSPDISENNSNMHGTLVTKYILDAARNGAQNSIQIMPLKTHDETGYGDLFNTICAIHYAIDMKANIINASWGFYYYDSDPHPYLTNLIKTTLKEKGILFVTAAGNKIEEADTYANSLYMQVHGTSIPDTLLRNLSYHRFYPASLSKGNKNIITVTTNDKGNVSPTQNYYSEFVNIGVFADTVMPGFMRFRLPFSNATGFISGSSFATAIMTGTIAAHIPTSHFGNGVDRENMISWMENNAENNGLMVNIVREPVLGNKKRIELGRYLSREK